MSRWAFALVLAAVWQAAAALQNGKRASLASDVNDVEPPLRNLHTSVTVITNGKPLDESLPQQVYWSSHSAVPAAVERLAASVLSLRGGGVMPTHAQVAHVTAATVTALSVSMDDAVWLLPFLLSRRWLGYSACYVSVRLLMLFISFSLTCGVDLMVKDLGSQEEIQFVLQVGSCLLLTSYSVKLFADWYCSWSSIVDSPHAPCGKDQAQKSDLTICHLYLIAILGNLDNVALFTPLLVSGTFSPGQMLAGVVCAALCVISLLLVMSSFRGCGGAIVTLEKLPLWCIVGGWSIWSAIHLLRM
eukprot:TRINITY_DN50790_c0_g2_i1.p1 TRINITY_DN50790_c0_g2~~TRINITY_DN50790_c0_g2_i1.p1  ORF type:complete len:302 (-),score=52.69 TRINITY_DN50790_c0_g2_i1:280-1185(-)